MHKEHKKEAIKSTLERFEHSSKDSFNKHLKHQKRSNKKLGLSHDFGIKGVEPIR